ncbi:transglycosylase domain-containing protein [Microlunatus parietis]|uniref:Membrane peptidoglycan carboxypeptidase n=1 Tax=Microlunatus parietis TaxID=682979 RepID=A0A7Y9IC32_9ACTN|nr:transglycosylase domain-containing protein [Microlunatus parietis]NYE74082.1 membrane peptidoglycan carboxypeptidase [Microlunatus parietis]
MLRSARRVVRVLTSAVLFVAVSALAGLLVAALVAPFAGGLGLGARAASDQLGNLPADFEVPAQSERSTILDVNGDVLAYFYAENRVYKPLQEIAPVMPRALLAIEDHRYYEHGPLDPIGTLRAFLTNQVSGGVTQGGSSITQQYVKMVLIDEAKRRGDEAAVRAAQESTYERKIQELRYAIALEQEWSKDEILERYLNIAYFGDGAYGVEAAAKHYFNTTAAKLTLAQAAMLAGLVQNPTQINPVVNEGAALERRDVVLNRMAELGMVGPADVAAAKKTGFDEDLVRGTRNGCVGTDYPFLCDYVYDALMQTPSLGATADDRENAIKRGGLTVRTAIDPETQDIAQQAVSDVVGPTDPVIATMNMIQPGTGLIVAMAQSRPVMGDDAEAGETYWNYAIGEQGGFQAGSTFKAITSAAALEKGIPLSKRYDARGTMDFSGETFDTCDGRSRVYGDWEVSNSTGTNGEMDMYRAAQRSVNTYYVQLELDTGMCRVIEMAEKLGIVSTTADRPLSYYQDKPSFTLGTVEISPLSLAEAYATFASGGIHCDPIVLESITRPDGSALAVPSGNCRRVLEEDVANAMNDLLASVMTDGTGQRVATDDGRPQAGKTGTTSGNQAVSFAGYTPEISGAAMISVDVTREPFRRGGDDFRSSGVKGYRVPSTGFVLEGSGSGDAGQEIWKPAMEEYLEGKPETRFEAPPRELTDGRLVDLPALFGLSPEAATKRLEEAGFTVRRTTEPSRTVPAGQFIRFTPDRGRVPEFSTIRAVYSSGPEPSPPR